MLPNIRDQFLPGTSFVCLGMWSYTIGTSLNLFQLSPLPRGKGQRWLYKHWLLQIIWWRVHNDHWFRCFHNNFHLNVIPENTRPVYISGSDSSRDALMYKSMKSRMISGSKVSSCSFMVTARYRFTFSIAALLFLISWNINVDY